MLDETGKQINVDTVARTSGSRLCVFIIPVNENIKLVTHR